MWLIIDISSVRQKCASVTSDPFSHRSQTHGTWCSTRYKYIVPSLIKKILFDKNITKEQRNI